MTAELPEGWRRDRLEAPHIPEWETIIAAPATTTTRRVRLTGLPRRLRIELAWMMRWVVQDGQRLEIAYWSRWVSLLR